MKHPINAVNSLNDAKAKPDIENALRTALRTSEVIPQWQEQQAFIRGRRYRADFIWPAFLLIAECDGGTWKKGQGHSTGVGIRDGYRRANAAQLEGYVVLRFTTDMITSGEALATIERYFQQHRISAHAAQIGVAKAMARINAMEAR